MTIPTSVYSGEEITIEENTRNEFQETLRIELPEPNELQRRLSETDLISEPPSPIFKKSTDYLSSPDDKGDEFESRGTSPSDLGDIPLRMKTIEDVENAGCSVGCLQAKQAFWTISTGIFDFFGGIGNPIKSSMVTISTLSNYSNDLRKIMGISTTIVSAGTLTFNMLAKLGYKRATDAQKELKDIEEKIELILQKYNQEIPKSLEKAKLDDDILFEQCFIIEDLAPYLSGVKFKMSPTNLTTPKSKNAKKGLHVDKLKLEKLKKRYSELTELSEFEKSYFSASNFFLRNIHSTADITAILCNASNLVMIPLSTIPVWDPVTTTALGIVTVCLEGGSILAAQMARQSESTNQSVVSLENDLEEFNI